MDFSVIFQLRTKKFWWMDVVFYFVISLLVSTVLCYLIFFIKDFMIRKQINDETAALQTVGTLSQKDQEQYVIKYQGKINDFSNLLKDHEFASNVFVFVQTQTIPNIWFKQFNLDEKNGGVKLSGETDNMDSFSRQVSVFENNKYVKSVNTLNSSSGESAKINFNINLILDQSIFSYISNTPAAVIPALQPITQQNQTQSPATSSQLDTPVNSGTINQQVSQPSGAVKSKEKLITSFHIPLSPEVIGVIDETNYTVTLTVPYNTDVQNLTPSITTSPSSTILPASNVSQNFTSPVLYTVTAEDGSIQSYQVKVIIGAQPAVNNKSNWSKFSIILAIILLTLAIVAIIVIIFFLYQKRLKSKKKL